MSFMQRVLNNIIHAFGNPAVPGSVILAVLLMVLLLSVYEFVIYRAVSHRSFYNRAFNISICVLPFFIATIILCLQSNLVITLGTIGALAIIRYRTAVKDPVDMLYILWSIHTGIVCGCQLYEVGVLTSLIVTLVLLLLEHLNFGRRPYVLAAHADSDNESELTALLKATTQSFRFKSRGYTGKGVDYTVEFSAGELRALTEALQKTQSVSRFSIIDYDAEDIL